jgi:hypothetical protein
MNKAPVGAFCYGIYYGFRYGFRYRSRRLLQPLAQASGEGLRYIGYDVVYVLYAH